MSSVFKSGFEILTSTLVVALLNESLERAIAVDTLRFDMGEEEKENSSNTNHWARRVACCRKSLQVASAVME